MSASDPSDFLSVFRSLFQDSTDSIVETTLFRELEEWSSMQALIVIAAIDEHYGVTITEKDFRAAQTVADLYTLTLKP